MKQGIISATIASCFAAALPLSALAGELAVTPQISAPAEKLLYWLAQRGPYVPASGGNPAQGGIVSGQQEGKIDSTHTSNEPLERVFALTQKWPAIRGFDFASYSVDRGQFDNGTTQRAIDWYVNKNGIVEISWHWGMTGTSGVTEVYYVHPGYPVTNFDIILALTDGTAENARFMADMDLIVAQLQILQANGVPVLWRPFHESPGSFWWSAKGATYYKAAWRKMFDYFKSKNLKNLIWVFTPGSPSDIVAWYPGDEYVDIVGHDGYAEPGQHVTFAKEYQALQSFMDSKKLLTLSENGALPKVPMADEFAFWSGFMTWHDHILDPTQNSDAYIQQVYNTPAVLNRANVPAWSTATRPVAGAATQLAFTRAPRNVFLGDGWFAPVYAGAVDATGKIDRTKTGTVRFTQGTTTYDAPLVNGVARFDTNKKFTAISSTQTVTASMNVPGTQTLWSTTSASFRVGTATDNASFPFETSTSLAGWSAGSPNTQVALSTEHAFAGNQAVKVTFNNSAPGAEADIVMDWGQAPSAPQPARGFLVSVQVWIPAASEIHGLSLFAQDGENWRYTESPWADRSVLMPGTWNTLTLRLPSDSAPLKKLGLKVYANDGKTLNGPVYIDSVSYKR